MTPATSYLILFVSALVFFAVINLIWMGAVAKNFYRQSVGHLLGDTPHWSTTALLYVIFIGGLMFFSLLPAVLTGSPFGAAFLGALYGFFTYATYNLMNHAMLRDWPVRLVIVDLLWGTLASALTAIAAFTLWHWFF